MLGWAILLAASFLWPAATSAQTASPPLVLEAKIPLGDVPELAAKGIHDTGAHYPKVGPVVTAGGLLFTGTRDRKVRAFDVATGKLLWETEVDAALEGMPAVYEIGGREFIVFCAAAQAGLTPSTQGKIPGAYIAFALPVNRR